MNSKVLPLLLVLILILSYGCGEILDEVSADKIQDPDSTDAVEGSFSLSNSAGGYSYLMHQRAKDKNSKCEIASSQLGDAADTMVAGVNDIVCWLEVEELDLSFKGLSLSLNVPKDSCEYIRYKPYWFWRYQPGSSTNSHIIYQAPTGCTPTVQPEDQDPIFTYNHTSSGGPNCDTGYSIPQIYVVADTSPVGTGDSTCANSTFIDSGEDGNTIWTNGKYTNCISGPGSEMRGCSGYPQSTVYYANDGAVQNFSHKSSGLMGSYFSTRYLSNYSNKCTADQLWLYSQVDSGSGMALTTDPLKNGIQPFYVWECLDKAYDIKARIRLQVRDWDRQFSHDSADITYHSYPSPTSMDGTGSEGEIAYEYWNDKKDWDNGDEARYDLPSSGPADCSNPANIGFDFPGDGL